MVRAGAGPRGEQLIGKAMPANEPTFAAVLTERTPAAFADFTHLDADATVLGEFGPAHAVPLGPPSTVSSGLLLALRNKGGDQFGEEQLSLLASFADQASLALELADKQRQQRMLDVLADRDRIAGDLHDHVIQRLFAAGMSLQGIVRRISDPSARGRVSRVVNQLDETVREIRTSIFDLQTVHETEQGSLRRRMLDVVAEASAGTRISPSVRIAGAVDSLVPKTLAEHTLAALREGISNAVRPRPGHVDRRHRGGGRRPGRRRRRRRRRDAGRRRAQRAAQPRTPRPRVRWRLRGRVPPGRRHAADVAGPAQRPVISAARGG